MGFELVGLVWEIDAFRDYFKTVNTKWAKSITLHHTAEPSLIQRPVGLIKQHIENIKYYYKEKLGWSTGPHLFIDDDEIYGMSSLWRRGVHARSFNKDSIGIEVLGDYDVEDPTSGRGLACWTMAAQAVAVICQQKKMDPCPVTIKFHRDDPKTSKTCPGEKVSKEWFISLVKFELANMRTLNISDMTLEQRVERLEKQAGFSKK